MLPILILAFLVTAFAGAMVFLNAKSAIHEIEGMLLLLIAALCFCTAVVLAALTRLQRLMAQQGTTPAPSGEEPRTHAETGTSDPGWVGVPAPRRDR